MTLKTCYYRDFENGKCTQARKKTKPKSITIRTCAETTISKTVPKQSESKIIILPPIRYMCNARTQTVGD